MTLLSQGSELATLWLPASGLNRFWHYATRVWMISYQRLQSLCTVLPAGWSASACLQGHMSTGTHWPWSSWASPSGHWHPGTQTLLPSCSSQLQPSHRSAQDVPHRRPHSWYTCPPEHCTAAGTHRPWSDWTIIIRDIPLHLYSERIWAPHKCFTILFNTTKLYMCIHYIK